MSARPVNDQVNEFIEHAIRLVSSSFGGSGFHISSVNPASSKIELGQNLQRSLMEFKRRVLSNNTAGLAETAQQIDGHIQVATTLGALIPREADELLEELYAIVERN